MGYTILCLEFTLQLMWELKRDLYIYKLCLIRPLTIIIRKFRLQKVKAVSNFGSVQFPDNTSAFADTCDCQPRCEREAFPLQISSAPISEYASNTLKWKDSTRDQKRFQIEQYWVCNASRQNNSR